MCLCLCMYVNVCACVAIQCNLYFIGLDSTRLYSTLLDSILKLKCTTFFWIQDNSGIFDRTGVETSNETRYVEKKRERSTQEGKRKEKEIDVWGLCIWFVEWMMDDAMPPQKWMDDSILRFIRNVMDVYIYIYIYTIWSHGMGWDGMTRVKRGRKCGIQ